MLSQCGEDLDGQRDYILIELLRETGLLISDALKITCESLKEGNYNEFKQIKNNKIINYSISDLLADKINVYIQESQKEEKKQDFIR